MAGDTKQRVIKLVLSAFHDGAGYTVTINEPATGQSQTIEHIVADSPEHAIERVTAIMERKAKAAMGDEARVTRGPLIED